MRADKGTYSVVSIEDEAPARQHGRLSMGFARTAPISNNAMAAHISSPLRAELFNTRSYGRVTSDQSFAHPYGAPDPSQVSSRTQLLEPNTSYAPIATNTGTLPETQPLQPAAFGPVPPRIKSKKIKARKPKKEPEWKMGAGQPHPPPLRISLIREVIFVGVVAFAHFTTQAALGSVLVPLDIIGDTFQVENIGQSAWFVAAYSLSVGTFILISGRLGDILGHKRMFVFGYTWFGVWAAFCGFAAYPRSQIFFDICRAMQGIGPAIIMPNGLALFGRAYPPGIKKNIVFSIFGALAPAGFVAGAAAGSLFAQVAWWPWSFWTFAFTCWGLAIIAMFVVPPELSAPPKNPPGFDFLGAFLGVTGLVLVNIAWNNAPMYGWGDPSVYFLLIIGIVALCGFVWVEKKAKDPILPLQAMNGTVLFILGCVGFGWGAFGVWVFYIFRWLETIRGYSPLAATATFGPAPICGLLAAGLTGFMLTHTPVSFVMMVSMSAFFVGTIVAATMPAHQTYWAQLFVSVVIMPFGMDMSFPAAAIILSNHTPPEHQGLAQSLVNTVLNYFISIALGIAGTVEVNVAKPGPGVDVHSEAFLLRGYKSALYTSIGLSGMGLLCGIIYFITDFRRSGWKIMDH